MDASRVELREEMDFLVSTRVLIYLYLLGHQTFCCVPSADGEMRKLERHKKYMRYWVSSITKLEMVRSNGGLPIHTNKNTWAEVMSICLCHRGNFAMILMTDYLVP